MLSAQSIYEMLVYIQATQQRHSNRFEELTAKVDGLDTKLDNVLGLLRDIRPASS